MSNQPDKPIEQTWVKLPSVKVGIGTLFTLGVFSASICAAIFWLFADKRNSELFVTRYEYAKDQKFMSEKISDIQNSQSEMRADVKTLLKESSKK